MLLILFRNFFIVIRFLIYFIRSKQTIDYIKQGTSIKISDLENFKNRDLDYKEQESEYDKINN